MLFSAGNCAFYPWSDGVYEEAPWPRWSECGGPAQHFPQQHQCQCPPCPGPSGGHSTVLNDGKKIKLKIFDLIKKNS